MRIQGNQEPLPGQKQEHLNKSIYFHSDVPIVPIKKRRFPIIRPSSPEEKILDSVDNESKKQDSQIQDEKETKNNQGSSVDNELKKQDLQIPDEKETKNNQESVDNESKKQDSQIPDEKESKNNQESVDNESKKQGSQIPDEKESRNNQESPIDTRDTSSSVQTSANKEVTPSQVKSGQATVDNFVSEPPGTKPATSIIPVADFRNETNNISSKENKYLESEVLKSSGPQTAIVKQDITCRPEKLDPSLLSLTLSEEKPAELNISDCTTVAGVGTIRSNWDLNTPMENWEGGSSKSDSLFAHTFDDIGGSVKKTSSYHGEKSSLTTAENIGCSLNKEQHIPDLQKNSISLGLRLDVPRSPNLGLQSVRMPANYRNRVVKSEPVDESTRRDCSVGSSTGSSISNMVSLRLGSLKTEPFNNLSLESVSKSPLDPDKLVNHSGSVKAEVHQESCASSSSFLTVPLMPQNNLELSIPVKETQLRPHNTYHKPKLARVDEAAADDDEKRDVLAELNKEESFESDCGSRDKCAVGNSVDIRESIRGKEDEDIEEGEVRDLAIEEGLIAVLRNPEKIEYVGRDSKNLQGSSNEDFDGKDCVKENLPRSDVKKQSSNISSRPNSEDGNNNHLQCVSNTTLEVRVGEKTLVSLTPDRQLDLSGRECIEETLVKEIQTNVDSGMFRFGTEVGASSDANNHVQEICPVDNISTLSGHDSAKDSGNKSRIIDISHASVVSSPCNKMRPIPNRLMIPRSGKERYSDLDGEIQSWGNREGNYSGGSNKFTKDRVNDESQSFRNSRPNFMRGRGRMSNRFTSFRSNEWDSDHDFSSGTSYGPSNYRSMRHKNTSGVETECNNAYGNNDRRKTTNDEFRRSSLRDVPSDRGNKNIRRFHRNMSPNGDRFIRNLSDDMNSIYSHPQAMYDEPDLQLDRGNRNFTMQRKGYRRRFSKSPIRSRTRSPGPWSSPQHRSPGFYRPDRECFRDDMVPKRRGSPYGARHMNSELQSRNFRRGSGRAFQRNRRSEELDSEGDEYMNSGPLQSNERRGFGERRGPVNRFYSCGDGENFRFHMNDGGRPYRFCPDADGGNNTREREFDERIKHQAMGSSRRSRNVEEMQDGDYERVWQDEGFVDDGGKKRRV